ncbi:MAG: MerR family transcriptional regulator [Bryobacterales bacterium]|nr:MerR family transcriptional regulator [Bryobacterales bacterium]
MAEDLLDPRSAGNGEQAERIPDKLYFRIGEVSSLVGVEPYVLRYWESEFSGLSPKRSGSRQRLYRRKDVELLLAIKHLLYDRRFTIEGARQFLKQRSREAERPLRQANLFAEDPLPQIRRELSEILEILK